MEENARLAAENEVDGEEGEKRKRVRSRDAASKTLEKQQSSTVDKRRSQVKTSRGNR